MWVCDMCNKFVNGIRKRRAAAVVIQKYLDTPPPLVNAATTSYIYMRNHAHIVAQNPWIALYYANAARFAADLEEVD